MSFKIGILGIFLHFLGNTQHLIYFTALTGRHKQQKAILNILKTAGEHLTTQQTQASS